MVTTSVIVGGLLCLAFILLFAWIKHQVTEQESTDHLTDYDWKQMKRLLDGKAKIVVGSFCDNFCLRIRNEHPLISMVYPMKVSPIDGHERICMVNTALAYSFVLGAWIAKNNKTDWWYPMLLISLPLIIINKVLIYLSMEEEKKLIQMKEDGQNEAQLRATENVQAAMESDPFLKFADRSAQFYMKYDTKVAMASYTMIVVMVLASVCWIAGIAISHMSGSNTLIPFILGYLQNWVVWFFTAPLSFSISWLREKDEEGASPLGRYVSEKMQEEMKEVSDDAIILVDKENAEKTEFLSTDEAKAAVKNWAEQQCCYGTESLDSMEVENLCSCISYRYCLQSFCEARTKGRGESPYSGGSFTLLGEGDIPELWDMEQIYSEENKWRESSQTMEVPYTSEIKTCPKCSGSGTVTRGSGDDKREETCDRCKGSGKIRTYQTMTSKWGTNTRTSILNFTELPDNYVKECADGKVVVEEEKDEGVDPINEGPDDLVQASQVSLVHVTEIVEDDRIRMHCQKHSLLQIHIHEFIGRLPDSEEERRFWVYGLGNRVFFPFYPETNCSLLDCNLACYVI